MVLQIRIPATFAEEERAVPEENARRFPGWEYGFISCGDKMYYIGDNSSSYRFMVVCHTLINRAFKFFR